MTWIKLDDKAPRHPKIASLSDRSFRWWVKGLCYASEFLTNGVLHPIFWKEVPKQSRAELNGNHLWDWSDPNFVIHDYLSHQSSREDVEAEKQRSREKVAAFRERRKAERSQGGNQSVTGNGNQSVTGNSVTTGNRLVTDPENREQIQRSDTDTEIKNSARATRGATLIQPGEAVTFERKHGRHLDGFCDWCCLPMDLVERFSKRIPGDDDGQKRRDIKQWALSIRATWETRIIPDGSDYEFWTNRWTETHGGSRPANATLKAARAANAIDEAFR